MRLLLLAAALLAVVGCVDAPPGDAPPAREAAEDVSAVARASRPDGTKPTTPPATSDAPPATTAATPASDACVLLSETIVLGTQLLQGSPEEVEAGLQRLDDVLAELERVVPPEQRAGVAAARDYYRQLDAYFAEHGYDLAAAQASGDPMPQPPAEDTFDAVAAATCPEFGAPAVDTCALLSEESVAGVIGPVVAVEGPEGQFGTSTCRYLGPDPGAGSEPRVGVTVFDDPANYDTYTSGDGVTPIEGLGDRAAVVDGSLDGRGVRSSGRTAVVLVDDDVVMVSVDLGGRPGDPDPDDAVVIDLARQALAAL